MDAHGTRGSGLGAESGDATAANTIYQRPDDYDLEHACAADDTRFYGHVLRRLDPLRVLELACGTGRVLTALATALPSSTLVGVDTSPQMLAKAEQRLAALPGAARERVRLVEGDMRTWTDETPFDAVLIGCCSVSHLLTLDDRRRTWTTVRECLRPGGHFLMDVKMPDLATLAEAQRIAPRALVQLDVDASRRTVRGPARLLRCTATMYDPETQRADVRFLYDRFDAPADADPERFVTDFPSHVYFPSELELLFATSGFELVQRYGDYGFVPFGRVSPYLITLARRA
jgi:SAM-dependent methyltransferase